LANSVQGLLLPGGWIDLIAMPSVRIFAVHEIPQLPRVIFTRLQDSAFFRKRLLRAAVLLRTHREML
jgi:hypothetical protein